MRLKFFSIPATPTNAAEAALNQLLAMHRVSQVGRQFQATWASGMRISTDASPPR